MLARSTHSCDGGESETQTRVTFLSRALVQGMGLPAEAL
jgi:hypothetical protein